ncbi:unnamed protein product, partial [Ectocarpus sp. 13 AM-2016]
MGTDVEIGLLGGPKLQREGSNVSTWDWSESGWDGDLIP